MPKVELFATQDGWSTEHKWSHRSVGYSYESKSNIHEVQLKVIMFAACVSD